MPTENSGNSDRLIEQYHALIDKKFSDGLTPEEGAELIRLNWLLDLADEPYYKATIEYLHALVTGLSPEDAVAVTKNWELTNARRAVLIEKKVQRQISAEEDQELAHLQHLAGVKRELTAPLPLEELAQAELLQQLQAIPNPEAAAITGREPYTVAELIQDVRDWTPRGRRHIQLWRSEQNTLRGLGKTL